MTQIVSYPQNNFNQLERLAETELNKLQKWINANKLTINFDPKKSSNCIFKPKNKCLPVNFDRGLTMGTKVLKYKENTRYLGLLLDHKLTWESHIKELNKKTDKIHWHFKQNQTLSSSILSPYRLQCFHLFKAKLWV